jgi:hypothetical protein
MSTTVTITPTPTAPAPRRPRWPLIIVIGAILLAMVVIAVLVLAFGSSADRPAHALSAPRGDRHTGRVDLVSGAGRVTVHSGDLGGDLYRISTPDGSGSVPRVVDDHGVMTVSLASAAGEPGGSPALVDIELSSAVAWQVRISGGATEARIDLRDAAVSVVDLASGVSTVDVTLGRPHGTVTVREGGGASEFAVHLPSGAPAQLAVLGGAGSAVVDGATHSGIGGSATYTPSGWASATDRFDVQAVGGVSQVRLDRY